MGEGDYMENYFGNDLGAVYTLEKTSFRLWAPTAEKVLLCFYEAGDGDCLMETIEMQKDIGGTWLYTRNEDMNGVYYTYLVTVDGVTKETVDPYAKACGVNGNRGMVVDLASTNPEGFVEETRQAFEKPTDAIIYEIAISDMTGDVACGVKHPGKFMGLAEFGTKNANGYATGIDYIKSLGVTHVQLMPSYDFGSVDETKPLGEEYNWGYDPVNYNVPEGSYSTDPYHGEVRIKEMKTMILAMHKAGLRVVMDVVYNHTYDIPNSVFQKTYPDYYYRKDGDKYSDASACNNEVASDMPMCRKYIVDSVVYWAKEYHIDGFRFDLMGVLDIETMQAVKDALDEVSKDIIVYGEGWTGGPSTLPDEVRALKKNTQKLNGVGAFSDDLRDGIRGSVFYDDELGFATGEKNTENDVRFSVCGATYHSQVDYDLYDYSEGPWAKNPCDVINYASCHDNMTLWDKLTVSCIGASEDELLRYNRFVAAIVFTCQGIPFILSGEEFGRTKPIEGTDKLAENSYNLPLYTNRIDYVRAQKNEALINYYRGLIAFRKEHEALKLTTASDVQTRIKFYDLDAKDVVSYSIEMEDEVVFVSYNAALEAKEIAIPFTGSFDVYIEGDQAGTKVLRSVANQVTVNPVSCLVAVMKK